MHKKIAQLYGEYYTFLKEFSNEPFPDKSGLLIAAALLTQTHVENVPGTLGIYPGTRPPRGG